MTWKAVVFCEISEHSTGAFFQICACAERRPWQLENAQNFYHHEQRKLVEKGIWIQCRLQRASCGQALVPLSESVCPQGEHDFLGSQRRRLLSQGTSSLAARKFPFRHNGTVSLLLFIVSEVIYSFIHLRIKSGIQLNQRHLNLIKLIIFPMKLLNCSLRQFLVLCVQIRDLGLPPLTYSVSDYCFLPPTFF